MPVNSIELRTVDVIALSLLRHFDDTASEPSRSFSSLLCDNHDTNVKLTNESTADNQHLRRSTPEI